MKLRTAVVMFFVVPSLVFPGLAKSEGAQAPSTQIEITEDDQLALNRALLQYAYRNYSQVSSPAEFDRTFIANSSIVDKARLGKAIRSMKSLPSAKIEKNALIFAVDDKSYRLDLIDPLQNKIRVNGVLWTLHFNKPLYPQIGLLERKLSFHTRRSALYDLVIPSAQAAAPAAIVAVPVISAIVALAGAFSPYLPQFMNMGSSAMASIRETAKENRAQSCVLEFTTLLGQRFERESQSVISEAQKRPEVANKIIIDAMNRENFFGKNPDCLRHVREFRQELHQFVQAEMKYGEELRTKWAEGTTVTPTGGKPMPLTHAQ